MPFLSVVHLTGDVDRYELTKQAPLSIGSHSSNNIALDEAGVEILHCRIAWAKSGYEAVAAGMQGIDVNGSIVQRAMLKPGDVLRFGTVDMTFEEGTEPAAPKPSRPAAATPDFLEPLEPEPPRKKAQAERPAASPPASSTRPSPSSKRPAAEPLRPAAKKASPPPDDDDDDDDFFTKRDDALMRGFDALLEESQSALPTRKDEVDDSTGSYEPPPGTRPRDKKEKSRPRPAEEAKRPEKPKKPKPEKLDDVELLDDIGDLEEPAAKPSAAVPPPAPAAPAAAPSRKPTPSRAEPRSPEVSDRLRKALRTQDRHPSDRDPLQSPLVLGLAGVTVVLAMVGAVLYFMAGRQTTAAAFTAAKQLYDDKKYNTAIVALEKFATEHPDDLSAEPARIMAGLARVDQAIESATPDYPAALQQLKDFVTARRDKPGFEEQHTAITDRAGRISAGEAELAGKAFDRSMLDISREARGLLQTFSPKDSPPEELLKQIGILERTSEAQILRHETFVGLTKEIDAALTGQSPMKALSLRRDLLARYPEFASDKKVTGLMASTLAAEKAVVRAEDMQQPAKTDDPRGDLPEPATVAFSARSRSDQLSVGEAVYVLAKDSLYGVDTVTGAAVWRRVVGVNLPFFPILERGTPSLIVFDTARQELVRIHQHTGKLLWRQPLPEAVQGQPLLDEKQLYIPVKGGTLYKLELDSGSLVGKVTFSQSVTGPAALRDGKHLVVVGNQEVVYTLSKSPLECVAVSYVGHPAGSVEAPLLTMGSYVLAIQNTGDSGILRVLKPAEGGLAMVDTATTPAEIAQRTVTGRVLDAPVIRGRDLFVPSSGERVSAFSISDDTGEPPITPGPVFQTKSQRKSAVFLSTGPERQLWMAGSALRKLQLTPKALTADEKTIASGLASQPNQHSGNLIFNARRRSWTDAVTLTQTDRDEMVSEWQAVLGSKLLAWSVAAGDSPGIVIVTEAGNTSRATLAQAGGSGFSIPPVARLTLSEDLVQPLLATPLAYGQIAGASGDPEPKLFLINRLGQVDRQLPISQATLLPPVVMGKRIVLAPAGKLQVLRTGGEEAVQDFSLPAGNEPPPKWRDVQAVDGTTLAALTETGTLILIRQEKAPRAHLAEITRTDLGAETTGRLAVGEEHVAVGTADHKLSVFSRSLEPAGTRTFDGALTNDIWISGRIVFVDEGGTTLHAIRPGASLDSSFTLPLEGSPVAGAPLVHNGKVVVAQQDGTIRFVDLESGEAGTTFRSPAALASGPFLLGGELFVVTFDGSFQKIPPGGRPAGGQEPGAKAEPSGEGPSQ